MGPREPWFATAVRRHPVLGGVTALYVAAWTAYGIVANAAGVYSYLIWVTFVATLLMYVDYSVRFSTSVLVMLSIVGFGHMAGANLYFSGVLLYEQALFGFIRYDQLIHVAGLGTAGLIVWEATRRMLAADGGTKAAVVVILGANSVGAVIEIGEYLATLTLPDTRVGAYANNMQDLIANLLGSLIAAWWVSRRPDDESVIRPRPVGHRSRRGIGDLATKVGGSPEDRVGPPVRKLASRLPQLGLRNGPRKHDSHDHQISAEVRNDGNGQTPVAPTQDTQEQAIGEDESDPGQSLEDPRREVQRGEDGRLHD